MRAMAIILPFTVEALVRVKQITPAFWWQAGKHTSRGEAPDKHLTCGCSADLREATMQLSMPT